jgi:hypothetical protein
MSITREDVNQILTEVAHFAADRVGAMTVRPETAISAQARAGLTQEAVDLGLLTADQCEEGFGLWGQFETGEAMALNIGLLETLGKVNAGMAYHWHKIAIASLAARLLGLESTDQILIAPTGHCGLGRSGLVKYLRKGALESEEESLLGDWLDHDRNGVIAFGPENWSAVLWPVWRNNEIAWRLERRDALEVTPQLKAHGLDELAAFEIRRKTGAEGDAVVASDAAFFYERILKMEAIGLMAIAAGAGRHTQDYAESYVAIRKQGGQLIRRHPAVQLAIGQIHATCGLAEGMLRNFERPLDEIDLADVFAARLMLHPALCEAANQSMQSHGGIGYMRDTGPEKIVRDQNMLRLALGGMRAANLFLGAWRTARH